MTTTLLKRELMLSEKGTYVHTRPTGKFMLTVLAGIAQFEREIMLERQREGVAKVKVAGKYKGRKPIALDRQQEVLNLVSKRTPKASIARQLGMGEATVYRILKKSKSNLDNPIGASCP